MIKNIHRGLFTSKTRGLAWFDIGKRRIAGSRGLLSEVCVQDIPHADTISTGEIAAIMEDTLEKWRLQRAPFWLVVPGSQTIVRSIFFPKASRRNIKRMLSWEWKEHFPLPETEFLYDCDFLAPQDGSGISAIVYACSRSFLQPWIQACEDAGVPLQGIELAPLCHLALLPDKDAMLIEAAAETTNITIIRAGNICYHRSFAVAKGRDFTTISQLPWDDFKDVLDIFVHGENAQEIKNCLSLIGKAGALSPISSDNCASPVDSGMLKRRNV